MAANTTPSAQISALSVMFKNYATYGANPGDGATITLVQIENWFTSAKLMNSTGFTTTELATLFGKFKAVSIEDFVRTLGDASTLLGMSVEELTNTLSTAPSPAAGTAPAAAAAVTPAVGATAAPAAAKDPAPKDAKEKDLVAKDKDTPPAAVVAKDKDAAAVAAAALVAEKEKDAAKDKDSKARNDSITPVESSMAATSVECSTNTSHRGSISDYSEDTVTGQDTFILDEVLH